MSDKEIRLTADELALMSMFQMITGVRPIHCVLEDNNVFFLVDESEYPKIISEAQHLFSIQTSKRKSKNSPLRELCKELAKRIGKNIYIVKFSEDPERFLRNFFMLRPDESVEFYNRRGSRKYVVIRVHPKRKGLVIGRGGFRAKVGRELARKYFGLETILIR